MSGDTTRKGEAAWPGFALPRGTTVNGYRLEQVLGSGGFGITYLAYDLLRQPFAIKEYFPRQFAIRQDLAVLAASDEDTALFEECRERFLREAQALVLLGRAGPSEGIVRVQTYFEAHGTCFLVMDYVEGTSLANVLRQEPQGLAASRVRSLLTQLLSSLRVVHRAGLMHRDIKPANIIMRDDDRVVLIDFGSSRPAARGDATSYTQIFSGGYAPPEQMLGSSQGEHSDIYAIGAVCYRAIGGRVVDALARQNSVAAGMADPQPPAMQVGAGRYPAELLAAVDAALATDPARRPQTVDAMLVAIGSAERPTVIAPRAPSATVAPRSRRGVWVAAAGAGALALVAAAYLTLRSPSVPPPVSHLEVAAVPPVAAPPAAPPVAAPSPPTAPPQPPTQAADTVPVEPIAPPPVSPPAQPQPQPQPRQEAIVVPPVASPPPATPAPEPPPPSPVELARTAAMAVPCSVLRVANTQDGIGISGFAPAGPDLDRMFTGLRDKNRVADAVTRVDRFACAPIVALDTFVRRTWDNIPPMLAVALDQTSVPGGGRMGIDVSTAMPALYLDLYHGDGSVRHLLRPAGLGPVGKRHIEWIATPPSGPRLIVAVGASAQLELGLRPETERASDYLAALQPALGRMAEPPAVDLAMVMVRTAEPMARVTPPRPANARPEKCANIVSRAQLGETLTDAELAALRTECRS